MQNQVGKIFDSEGTSKDIQKESGEYTPFSEHKTQSHFLDEMGDEEVKDSYDLSKKNKKNSLSLKQKGCLGCIVFFLIFLLILYFSPKTILEPLKYYLNGDFGNNIPEYEEIEDGVGFVDKNFFGEIRLTESELLFLMNKSPQIEFDRIESEEDKIILFVNLADDGNPLWLGFTITEENESFKLARVGFGRIALPEKLVNSIAEKIFGKISDSSQNEMISPITKQIFGEEMATIMNPQNVHLGKDEVVIQIVDTNSFLKDLDPEGIVDKWIQSFENYDMNEIKEKLANMGLEDIFGEESSK